MADALDPPCPTVFDIADRFCEGDWSRAAVLSPPEMESFASQLGAHYLRQRPRPVAAGEYWPFVTRRQVLSSALLYAHGVVVGDPLWPWLRDYHFYTDEERGPHLAASLERLLRVRPLSEAGLVDVVVGRPRESILDARRRVRGMSSEELVLRYGLDEDISLSLAAAAAEADDRFAAAIALNSDFATAFKSHDREAVAVEGRLNFDTMVSCLSSGARYLPTTQAEWVFLEHRLRMAEVEAAEFAVAKGSDSAVVVGLNEVALPYITDVDTPTLISIHTNENAFDSWRRGLRAACRTIEMGDVNSPAAAREAVEDFVVPAANEVRVMLSRSRAFRSTVEKQGLSLGITGFGAGALLAAGVAPPVAAGSAILGAATQIIMAVLQRPAIGDSHAVVARLLKK